MEPMFFLYLLILFWIPSIIVFFIAILSYKWKRFKKLLFIISIISFLIPWFLVFISSISEEINNNNFEGTYCGKDNFSNEVKLVIKDNNDFVLSVEKCKKYSIKGRWEYVKEYNAYLFYSNTSNFSINENYKGELILNSDLKTDCSKLDEIKLSKKNNHTLW